MTDKNNANNESGFGYPLLGACTAPQELINRAIGICKCIEEANRLRMPTRIIRMYAEESERITAEFKRYCA